jgi:hypothetical protein
VPPGPASRPAEPDGAAAAGLKVGSALLAGHTWFA